MPTPSLEVSASVGRGGTKYVREGQAPPVSVLSLPQSRVVGERRAQQIGARGEEVGEADAFVGDLPGADDAGPAHDVGHAVAALVDLRLVPAETAADEVALLGHPGHVDEARAPVVGGEEDTTVLDALSLLKSHNGYWSTGTLGYRGNYDATVKYIIENDLEATRSASVESRPPDRPITAFAE